MKFGVFSVNESLRWDSQVSPIRPCSSTTCSRRSRCRKWLTPSPAWPAPTTTVSSVVMTDRCLTRYPATLKISRRPESIRGTNFPWYTSPAPDISLWSARSKSARSL
jgi:hypothetical protein